MTNRDYNDTGCIFNIQKFSLHDGPGIRDLVFMKGCNLRCQWCSNPESQNPDPEIAVKTERCIGFASCGLCGEVCQQKAISRSSDDQVKIDRSLCSNCGDCASVCPDKALELIGRCANISEIIEIVSEDEGFHFRSGGGITVGGGDPILQSDFVQTLLKACRNRGIDTAIETAGHGKWDQLKKICLHANLIFYDVKSMDAAKHKHFTGVSNKTILNNLARVASYFPDTPIVVRTPLIPGFNATGKDIARIADFLKSIKTLKLYQLLPYHRFGTSKYRQLDKVYLFETAAPLDERFMRRFQAELTEELSSSYKITKNKSHISMEPIS